MNRRLPGRRDTASLTPAPGPFNPILLGPIAWYRGGVDISNIFGGVIYWGDQSGNGYHLEQNVVAWRPTISYVDGKQCVQGGGITFLHNDAFEIPNQPITVACIYNTNSSYGLSQVMVMGSNSNDCWMGYEYDGNGNISMGSANGGYFFLGGPFNPSPTPRVAFVEFSGTSSSAMYDGLSLLQVGDAGTAYGMGPGITVGNSYPHTSPFGGIMMEIIIFDKVLTGPDRQNLYDYFATQWTIA